MMWFDVFPLWPLMVLATLGLGAPLRLALMRSLRLTRSETLAWDLLWGMGLTGFLFLLAGHTGLLHPALGWGVVLIGAMMGVVELRRVGVPSLLHTGDRSVSVLHALTALALLWQVWGCLTPEFGGDALNYHIAAPLDWIREGRIVESPLRFQAAIPSHHLMVNTLLLLLGGDVLCKLMQTVQLIAAIALIAAMARRVGGRQVGALASCLATMSICAAWYRCPVFVRSDLLALLFATGALWSAVRWMRDGSARWAAIMGMAVGLTLSTKYTAIPFLLVPLMVGLIVAAPAQGGALSLRLRAFALITAGALLTFSPWMLREWLVTGDPVYPLLSDHLRIDPDYDEGRQRMAVYQEEYRISRAPRLSWDRWRLWKRRMRDASTEGDFLVVPLVLLAPIALLARRRVLRFLGGFGVAATAVFALITLAEIGRFYLITSPVSATLVAWALMRLGTHCRAGGLIGVAAGVLACGVLAQHQIHWSGSEHIRWHGQIVMTRASSDEFIRERARGFEWIIPAYQWMDDNLPEESFVLCVNHPFAGRMPRRHWGRGQWGMEAYDWLLARLGSPEAVTAHLRGMGITHVFRQGTDFDTDPSHWTWERESTRPIWHEGDVWVFALEAPEIRDSP
jgi:dolichyl-phosphate-mannose-protein mannosyltransferase